MRKELTPLQELSSCEICGRTILKGERTEPYLAPDGSRRLVCELCVRRAENSGWIREAAHADLPTAAPRPGPRPSLIERFRKWRGENGARLGGEPDLDEPPPGEPEPALEAEAEPEHAEPEYAEPAAADLPEATEWAEQGTEVDELSVETYRGEPVVEEEPAAEPEPEPPPRQREQAPGPRDPRHVRAVPTNSEVKVERALELFNASEHRRTVAGLVRTLGQPWVTAVPVLESPSEVTIVVAWELSWYQYRVDLGDAGQSILLADKGQEIHEIDAPLREWNGSATAEGELLAEASSKS